MGASEQQTEQQSAEGQQGRQRKAGWTAGGHLVPGATFYLAGEPRPHKKEAGVFTQDVVALCREEERKRGDDELGCRQLSVQVF